MNSKKLLLFSLIFGLFSQILARPTVQASNFNSTGKTCTSITLNWTNGNGNMRVIFGRKGTSTSYSPVDGMTYYGSNSNYGSSHAYGSNNDHYILYCGSASYVNISSLVPGETYCFSIYEFNYGQSGAEEYLTSNAPSITVTPYKTNLSVNVTVLDSCENSNRFLFTNNSNSTVPDVQYILSRYPTDTLNFTSQSLLVKMKGKGNVQALLTAKSAIQGCQISEAKVLKIFQADVAILELNKGTDTVQDFIGNYFEYATTGLLSPFPIGVTYHWDFGDNTNSNFAKMRKSYNNSGDYNVSVKMNITTYNKPTACRDTINFRLHVRYNPFLLISVAPKWQYKDSNKVYFTMSDTNATYTSWKFGDGDSSMNANTTHKYVMAGTYEVRLDFTLSSGKKGIYRETVEIVNHSNSSIQNPYKEGHYNTYPNPVSQNLFFNFSTPSGTEVIVYSSDGRMISKVMINKDESGIDVTDLIAGIYNLQVKTPDGHVTTIPFIKSN